MQYNLRGLLIGTAVVGVMLVLATPLLVIFPPFYYAEFRAVERRLAQVPNLEIVSSWQHKDMTLEDCGFVVKVASCGPVHLSFHDSQDWVGLFDEIQGIVFRNPTDRQQKLWVSRQQLRHAGLKIDGLTDVLHNLDEVLKFCERDDDALFTIHPDRSYRDWVHMRYPQD